MLYNNARDTRRFFFSGHLPPPTMLMAIKNHVWEVMTLSNKKYPSNAAGILFMVPTMEYVVALVASTQLMEAKLRKKPTKPPKRVTAKYPGVCKALALQKTSTSPFKYAMGNKKQTQRTLLTKTIPNFVNLSVLVMNFMAMT